MEDANANLTDMIDRLIDNDPEQAEQCFHDYLKPKIQLTVQDPEPDDNNKEQ